MTIVIDNCLPLSWIEFLHQHAHIARHWRELGASNAPDSEIIQWTHQNKAVVLTQDLDFTKHVFKLVSLYQALFNFGWTTCAQKVLVKTCL